MARLTNIGIRRYVANASNLRPAEVGTTEDERHALKL